MIIQFATADLRETCNDDRLATRRWGAVRSKLVLRRLAQMVAARTLAVLLTTPGRPHPLKGNRLGVFSIDLDWPYRLLFEPLEVENQKKSERKVFDLNEITAVRVLEIEDTHG